ncbi:MAG: hypothetical protein ACPGIJ_14340 [Mycobacterium sp.]
MQILGEFLEDRVVRVVDVAPHQSAFGGQVLRHRREREVVLGVAVAPDPASDVGHPVIIS